MSEFETSIISTNKYVSDKVQKYVYVVLFLVFFYALVGDTKFGKPGILLRNNAPLWLYILIIFALIVVLVLAIIKATNVNGKKGQIILTSLNIQIKNKFITYQLNSIEKIIISIDATKYKAAYNRDMLEGLGNNWITFNHGSTQLRYEFSLPLKEKEEELYMVLEEWKKNGIDFRLEPSKRNYWQKLLK